MATKDTKDTKEVSVPRTALRMHSNINSLKSSFLRSRLIRGGRLPIRSQQTPREGPFLSRTQPRKVQCIRYLAGGPILPYLPLHTDKRSLMAKTAFVSTESISQIMGRLDSTLTPTCIGGTQPLAILDLRLTLCRCTKRS